MKKIGALILFLFVVNAHAQKKPVYVTDSIMQLYKQDGTAAKNFKSEGRTDVKKLKQGLWIDYKIEKDFVCYNEDGVIKQLFGSYLIYGEGSYFNGKRTGLWKFCVIEDKTFKKILLQEATYKNGGKEGPLAYLLPNGEKGVTGTYHLDKIDGTFKNYYASGAVFSEHDYSVGVLNGPYKFYYQDGKVKSEGNYTNNIKDGVQQLFYHTGQVQEISNLVMGVEDGLYQYFYTNGQLSVEKEYKAGLLMNIKASNSPAGAARDKGTIRNGKGTVINYNNEGAVYAVQTFKGGKLISEDKKN
ncbi:hypothetical protein GR160_07445 [Flavobacterium sp. Sd200]|uniref:toxin-antitoxin system YwqK family antitoxin n=1 Tax=Flavobacterium sp. Sd200 TaxID=2692211 RepID=UPI0013685A18|nr:toxin-antitoxin system YwqK family antitoxin [Flavobacterium sp. Sd200]MXN91061.1 hypothetical protein [Flavobacterium sp. Sd200]